MKAHSLYFDLGSDKPSIVPVDEEPVVPVIVASMTPECADATLVIAQKLRMAGIPCTVDAQPGKFKRKLERASKALAYYVVILGPDEVAAGKVTLKDMDESTNETVTLDEAIAKLSEMVLTPEERRAAAKRLAINEALR